MGNHGARGHFQITMSLPSRSATPIVDAWQLLAHRRPWWAPFQDFLPGGLRWTQAQTILDMDRSTVAEWLNLMAPPHCPVRFVPQDSLPDGMAYEQFIGDTGQCPTRDNLHDFFNGLCWFRFPEVKSLFNRIQTQQIRQQGVGQHRGLLRDTITLLDEGGLFLQAPDALWEAIVRRDWRAAFLDLRTLWDETRIAACGHALLEKCVLPYKAITANVIRIPAADTDCDLDRLMALELTQLLTAAPLPGKPHQPLPVMGIPGWDHANGDAAFYDDIQVFRPPRPAAVNGP